MVRQKTSSTETAISEDKTTSQKTAKKPTSTAKAKKFMEMKENSNSNESVCCGNASGKGDAFCSWIRAYKNIFNFKGRTSRFEFWSFMLINLFAVLLFSFGIMALLVPDFPKVAQIVFLIFLIAETIIYLSICTRRLHDGGYTAWKGFFRPFIFNLLIVIVLLVLIKDALSQVNSWLAGFTFLFSLIYLYYGIKIFVATGFYEEENGTNEYGAMPAYCNKAYTQRGFKYFVLYMFLFLTVYVVWFINRLLWFISLGVLDI